MQKIAPCLWFDKEAEDAAKFYVSLFKNSKITAITRYGDGAPLPKGTVLTVTFQLEGLDFMALNGGPVFKFNPAISLLVSVKTQRELDGLWDKLSAGSGAEGQCGWLTDKFGVSWQIVPSALGKMMTDKDAGKTSRMMKALMKMKKLDIAALKKAFAG